MDNMQFLIFLFDMYFQKLSIEPFLRIYKNKQVFDKHGTPI